METQRSVQFGVLPPTSGISVLNCGHSFVSQSIAHHEKCPSCQTSIQRPIFPLKLQMVNQMSSTMFQPSDDVAQKIDKLESENESLRSRLLTYESNLIRVMRSQSFHASIENQFQQLKFRHKTDIERYDKRIEELSENVASTKSKLEKILKYVDLLESIAVRKFSTECMRQESTDHKLQTRLERIDKVFKTSNWNPNVCLATLEKELDLNNPKDQEDALYSAITHGKRKNNPLTSQTCPPEPPVNDLITAMKGISLAREQDNAETQVKVKDIMEALAAFTLATEKEEPRGPNQGDNTERNSLKKIKAK